MAFIHTTKSGEEIALEDITDEHLNNIIAYLKHKAQKGILVQHGGGWTFEPDTLWYNEEIVYGDEALEYMHYDEYIAEQERRKLTT